MSVLVVCNWAGRRTCHSCPCVWAKHL